MRSKCEGRVVAVEGETADAVPAAMMAHGDEAHSNLSDGKSPDEIQQMRQMMDAQVRQMFADKNRSVSVPIGTAV